MTQPMFLVKQVTVEASNKSWGEAGGPLAKGSSGSTSINWTLICPEDHQGPYPGAWTKDEALVVTLLARKELQRLLLLDAAARGAHPPDVGPEALPGYDTAMKALQGKITGEPRGPSTD